MTSTRECGAASAGRSANPVGTVTPAMSKPPEEARVQAEREAVRARDVADEEAGIDDAFVRVPPPEPGAVEVEDPADEPRTPRRRGPCATEDRDAGSTATPDQPQPATDRVPAPTGDRWDRLRAIVPRPPRRRQARAVPAKGTSVRSPRVMPGPHERRPTGPTGTSSNRPRPSQRCGGIRPCVRRSTSPGRRCLISVRRRHDVSWRLRAPTGRRRERRWRFSTSQRRSSPCRSSLPRTSTVRRRCTPTRRRPTPTSAVRPPTSLAVRHLRATSPTPIVRGDRSSRLRCCAPPAGYVAWTASSACTPTSRLSPSW